MSEGWEEWPLLGPGWKRRIAVRKSGVSCGHTDTYYKSPTGEKIRSRIELAKYFNALGSSVDLTLFDFRNGVIVDKGSPKKKKNSKRKSLPAHGDVKPQPKKPRLSAPLPAPEECEQNGETGKSVVRCHGCGVWFTGVEFGKSKVTKWRCADCRASRRAFNKEQKLHKNTGCGTCEACKVTENCGHCTVCLLRSHNPEFSSSWKCVRRRCLRNLRKGDDCGMCQGCQRDDDCEGCSVCLDKMHKPDADIKERCLLRRCVNKKLTKRSPGYKNNNTKKLHIKKPAPIKLKKKKKKKATDGKGQEKNIPAIHRSNNPVILERLKHEAGGGEYETVEGQQNLDPPLAVPQLRETVIKMEQTNGQHRASHIMEIFSLGSYHATGDLDRVLLEFMGELNEMPLPAHWEVLAPTGPNLQLVQRSRLSTMADTVIYIQPGLLFHVVVRGHPVPSSHELYNNHPSRLTTVDDVVELICDLEAHRPCPGLSKPRRRSPDCRVLVAGAGRCEECCKVPWPSGSSH
uniref:Methyl-CpG binding domain protein 1 n=1 Tax=Xenopus tropicalis TaxID=8364 RepID=A0A1B8Y150_XENTR